MAPTTASRRTSTTVAPCPCQRGRSPGRRLAVPDSFQLAGSRDADHGPHAGDDCTPDASLPGALPPPAARWPGQWGGCSRPRLRRRLTAPPARRPAARRDRGDDAWRSSRCRSCRRRPCRLSTAAPGRHRRGPGFQVPRLPASDHHGHRGGEPHGAGTGNEDDGEAAQGGQTDAAVKNHHAKNVTRQRAARWGRRCALIWSAIRCTGALSAGLPRPPAGAGQAQTRRRRPTSSTSVRSRCWSRR